MTISFNTGTTASATAQPHTVHPTMPIPAGVLSSDVMLVGISVFTYTPTTPDFTLTATSGHAWTNIGGGVKDSGANGGLNLYGKVWTRNATAGDAGDTLTFAFTGTQGATDQFWWSIVFGSYTGAGGVDVVATTVGTGIGGEHTAAVNTITAGDWAVFFGAEGVQSNGTVTAGPTGGGTIRENSNTAGIAGVLCDGNASVGSAGTSIGGGSFTSSTGTNWWADFTIGLKPPGGAPPSGNLLLASYA